MALPVPTEKQLAFLSWEMGVFFHFGIRTFYPGHTDWDEKPMDPAAFDPRKLDCGQWVRAAKAGGARYAVLTAKHHDGFALWPSRCTEYSVKNTPWRGGNGDVVREFVNACRAEGLKTGLYYSPAQFGSVKRSGKEYDDYFISQITELLTQYGQIDYLWFDGCGCEGHSFDTARIVRAIRALQPGILLFNLWDPDTRWVGNEDGVAPPDLGYAENGRFLPYECDCKLRPLNWFWSPNDAHTLRTPKNLEGLYELSVGRGGNLLLNIGPDDAGLLPEADTRLLAAFGERIRKKYAAPLPVEITQTQTGAVLSCAAPAYADTLVLEEDLLNGQRIERFTLTYRCGSSVLLHEGTRVGHKRIVHFPNVLLGYGPVLQLELWGENCGLKNVRLFNTEDNT